MAGRWLAEDPAGVPPLPPDGAPCEASPPEGPPLPAGAAVVVEEVEVVVEEVVVEVVVELLAVVVVEEDLAEVVVVEQPEVSAVVWELPRSMVVEVVLVVVELVVAELPGATMVELVGQEPERGAGISAALRPLSKARVVATTTEAAKRGGPRRDATPRQDSGLLGTGIASFPSDPSADSPICGSASTPSPGFSC